MAGIQGIHKKGTGPLDTLDLNPHPSSAQADQPATPQPGRLDPLFEKLGMLLGGGSGPAQGPGQALGPASTLRQLEPLGDVPISDQVRELIAKTDMLETMLDIAPVPEQVDISELFTEILAILRQLDKDVTELYKRMRDGQDRAVYKLKPSADTQDGFDKKITIEVR